MDGSWSDVLRLVIFVMSGLVVMATLRVLLRKAVRPMSQYQVARFLGQLIIQCGILAVQVARVHHAANWFTWVCAAATATSLYGMSGLIGTRGRAAKDDQ